MIGRVLFSTPAKLKSLKSFQIVQAKNYRFYNTQIQKIPPTTLPQRIVQNAPKPIQPYLALLRIDKPIGTYLLMYPCLWSLAIASKSPIPDPWLLFLFVTGN
jgi:hypothetical protein